MSRTSRPGRPSVLLTLTCLGTTALFALTGCTTAAVDARPGSGRAAAAQADPPPSGPASRTAPPPSSPSSSSSSSDEARPGTPAHVSIPSIGVESDIMRLGLNTDGTVEVPPSDKGMTTGWYSGGPVPGARGPAVLIGHNDTRYGRAVFHDLKKIAKGADIVVRDAGGTKIRFKVTGRETVGKKTFPTERVYGRTEGRVLRLITCDGAFDAQGHTLDNLIVYAMKV
ncbi:class F sortase [Streptomyces sp. NPDC021093]|uniref:class F sortase n=1 Tax=Streptomyces sp. NPDC021093 TaxID=3365112 RepID=UPI00378F1E85